ncbi:uncharacterized protein VP01_1449g6 [Puccinia sorghi]|uniref:HAT C-terminal dimerisation domain-containing protein n=1 Tax=Puccinia sorghi TaxID=27349 RepID=A0A0L6VK10_9BASI|nr:uncharacterized protein VP01_1449g6 [Puccinia sorghi]
MGSRCLAPNPTVSTSQRANQANIPFQMRSGIRLQKSVNFWRPSTTMALPISMSLIKTIYQICAKYNAAQLIPTANDMIIKLKNYLVLALKKTVPICSMILDPQIKLKYLKKNRAFLAEHDMTILTVNQVLQMFKVKARAFDLSPTTMQHSEGKSKNDLPKRSPCLSVIEANIFGNHECCLLVTTPENLSLLVIDGQNLLGHSGNKAPSECVFSGSKTIIGSQQHRHASHLIERIVCIKEWYQKFNQMMEISSVSLPVSNTPPSDDDSDRKDS